MTNDVSATNWELAEMRVRLGTPGNDQLCSLEPVCCAVHVVTMPASVVRHIMSFDVE